jgi:hypothetical protein
MMNVDLKKKNIERLIMIVNLLDEVRNDDWLIGLEEKQIDEIKRKIEELKLVIK